MRLLEQTSYLFYQNQHMPIYIYIHIFLSYILQLCQLNFLLRLHHLHAVMRTRTQKCQKNDDRLCPSYLLGPNAYNLTAFTD